MKSPLSRNEATELGSKVIFQNYTEPQRKHNNTIKKSDSYTKYSLKTISSMSGENFFDFKLKLIELVCNHNTHNDS